MKPDTRTAFVLAQVGADLRASSVRNRVGVYVNRRGRLSVVVRADEREAPALVSMVTGMAWDALAGWGAR